MAQYDGMTNYIARRIGPPGLYVRPFIYFLLLFNGSRHIKLASDKSARLESVAGSALFFCPADDALNESVRKSYISWLWAAFVVFRFSLLLASSTTFVYLDRSQRDDILAPVLQV